MASGVGKHKLFLGPTEPWSVREKLCLASSVMKSGDQNWVSVSRAIRPFAEPGRPPDWFSQKHCASQYSELLETTEAPKRKRGEKGEVVETIEDVIVRKLTAERVEELKRMIRDTQEKHRKLKREAEMIQAGHLDSKLEELWGDITQKKKEEDEEAEAKRKATEAAYEARQAVKNAPRRTPSVAVGTPRGEASLALDQASTDGPIATTPVDLSSTGQGTTVFIPIPEVSISGTAGPEPCQGGLVVQKATPPPSPLLSELLKKGNLLANSPRLGADGDLSGLHGIDLQVAGTLLPAQAASVGAPTLSRLLEAGPAHFPSSLGPPSASAPAAEPRTPHTTASAPPATDPPASLHTAEVKTAQREEEEEEEDLVNTSYIEDELDLDTVGEIIAIMENKVCDSVEDLDAAAVEAALSLSKDTGRSLSAPWEATASSSSSSSSSFKTPSSDAPSHTTQGHPRSREVVTDSRPVLASESQSRCGQTRSEATVPGSVDHVAHTHHGPAGGRHCNPGCVVKEEGPEEGCYGCPAAAGKCDTPPQSTDSVTEDPLVLLKLPKVVKVEEEEEEGEEDEEEDAVSGGAEGGAQEEEEECGAHGWCVECVEGEGCVEGGEGEGEGEGEPMALASESEDGCSMRTACSSLQLHLQATDSIASSPASSSQFSICSEDQEAIQAQKIWRKAIMLVWRAAANHRYANVFLQPVTDDIAPGYHSIVYRPMDLSTIKKNIEMGAIRTTVEFQRDVMLMFQNALMYNSSDHDVFHMAMEMQRDVLEQVQQFLATQLIMQTSESGISAKSLRGREPSHRQEPGDKDSVPMASPAFLLSLFDGGTRGRRCAIEADQKMKK
ncbi:bromodomain-containing protein 8 [Engraulis encrasicolus]|uniref:bromodomain-containing protein 8 n=1 Tax=Engraulis encrasicolus TaxID=184585 RepID=UPI002FD24C06